MDGLAAATEPWYCPVAMMKALHQARATSPPGLVSFAAHSLARSPVRPLLKVCSEICADACPMKARVAPRTEPRTLAGALDCDMPRLLLHEEPPSSYPVSMVACLVLPPRAAKQRTTTGDRVVPARGMAKASLLSITNGNRPLARCFW